MIVGLKDNTINPAIPQGQRILLQLPHDDFLEKLQTVYPQACTAKVTTHFGHMMSLWAFLELINVADVIADGGRGC